MIAQRTILPLLRSAAKPGFAPVRSFSTSKSLKDAAASTLPARKPVGAFRGGMFGFLSGAVAAGAVVYYYILGEYRVSNEMLNEDINVRL
ncbi:hypothetical protein MW887_003824 [Aspergillus wentii]|nr:hypothetical protein MW887_003824 [Aspergillus wentii]